MAETFRRGDQVIPQTCVIPFRRDLHGWQFCLITSLKKKRWIFPKGIVDPGETPAETGLKEAWEEAGLRGRVLPPQLGQFNDYKWNSVLHVQVMLMEVTECLAEWPEAHERSRVWLDAPQALARLKKDELRQMLKLAVERLEKEHPSPTT